MPENQTEVHGCTSTPGPWKAKPTTLPDVVEIRDSKGRQLASCYAVEYTNLAPVTVEETAANARLMAAAADYYAAVEYWLDQVYDGEPLRDWQMQLVKAHDKAKGEL